MLKALAIATSLLDFGISGLALAQMPGYVAFTHAEDPAVAEGTLYIRYTGPIDYPLAEALQESWKTTHVAISEVVFEIDSLGGPINHAAEVIAVLQDMRRAVRLVTVVKPGKVCASSCVPVYMQGEVRRAHPATAWMFHGAAAMHSNMPSLEATRLYVDLLRDAGINMVFLCGLLDKGYLAKPGEYWLSGYQLVHTEHAGVITELLDAWVEEEPHEPPFDRNLRPR